MLIIDRKQGEIAYLIVGGKIVGEVIVDKISDPHVRLKFDCDPSIRIWRHEILARDTRGFLGLGKPGREVLEEWIG